VLHSGIENSRSRLVTADGFRGHPPPVGETGVGAESGLESEYGECTPRCITDPTCVYPPPQPQSVGAVVFRQVNTAESGDWDTRTHVVESGQEPLTVTVTEPSEADCGSGGRNAPSDDGMAGAATRPTVGVGDCSARSAEGDAATDAGGDSALSLSHVHNSETRLLVQVDTRFPDGGYRRSVMVANECDFIECGDSSKCLLCADGILQKKTCRPTVVQTDEQRREQSARRTARNASDIIRASKLDHLLTPTAGKAFQSHTEALDAWSGYLDDARYGRWFRQVINHAYLAVAEPYSDAGGWHLHIALAGYLRPPHLMRLKVTWTGYLYERLGIARPDTEKRLWRVHIAPPGKHRSPRALGRYMAKYLTKGLDCLTSGTRRYRCGLGLLRPLRARSYHLLNDTQARLLLMDCRRYFEIVTADGRHLGWCGEALPRDHSPPVP